MLSSSHALPGAYSKQRKLDKRRRLFSVMWKIYSRTSKQKRTLVIPQDLVAARHAVKWSRQMYKDSPALRAICLRGKEEPFKDLLRRVWADARASAEFRSSGATPKLVHACLEKVIHRMAAREYLECLDVWTRDVGKNVSHHSGWLATMQKLQILKKVTSWGSGVLVLGRERNWYRVLPFGERFIGAFQHHLKLGEILQAMPTPESCPQMVAAIRKAEKDADKLKFPWKSLEYLWPWILRSHLVAQAHAAGVTKMALPQGFTMDDLKSMAPDQAKHVDALRQDVSSVTELFKRLEYDGPAELFSMYACLFLGKGSDAWDPEWVSQHMDQLIKFREQMSARDGMEPNPLILLQDFYEKHGDSE